jgi:hypothetical protein
MGLIASSVIGAGLPGKPERSADRAGHDFRG